MLNIEHRVREVPASGPGELPPDVPGSPEPMLIRGLVEHWPIVRAAADSPGAVENYLRRFYAGATVNAVYGKPGERGRLFYNEDLSGFNQVVDTERWGSPELPSPRFWKHRNRVTVPPLSCGLFVEKR